MCGLICWVLLTERINYLTAVMIICTLMDITFIAADNDGHNSIAGNLFALACAISIATNFFSAF
jgi:hypothetical protein